MKMKSTDTRGRRNIFSLVLAGVTSLFILVSSSMTAAGSIPAPALYDKLETFHGHVCAGSLFGARLGFAAREAVTAAGGTGKLKAHYFDHSCPVDGIQVSAGTTYGNGAILVEARNEHRLLLTAEGNNRQVEARLTKKAEQMGLRSRDLRSKAKAFPAGSQERKNVEQDIEEIFTWLKSAPTEDVVVVVLKGK